MNSAINLFIFLFTSGWLYGQDRSLEYPLASYEPSDSTTLLEAVIVEAYQVQGRLLNIPGSLSVLTNERISLSDGTNLAATLNTLPGVTMQSGTYATNRIVIRGMGSRTPYNTNRIKSYLNDIPLTTSDGVSTPEEIDLQSLGRLELVKGPSSALYGSGLGGSINLYTPVKTDNEGNISTQYGSYNTGKALLSENIHSGKADILGSLSHLQSDGYRENNYYKRTSLLTTASWKQQRWSVMLTLLLNGVNGGIPSSIGKTMLENNPKAAAPNWKAIGGYKKYFKGVSGITLTNKLSKKLTNRLTIFGRGNDSYEKRPFNNLDDLSLSAGLRNKLSLHNLKTDWILGTEWIAEQYAWNLDKNNILLNKNRENLNQLTVFAMMYYRPNPKLNISLAAALNHFTYRLTDLFLSNGDQSGKRKFPLIASPRIGINYSHNEFWAIYASAGRGFSIPSPEETLLPEGDVNPNLKPEQGFQYEIGSRLNLFDKSFALDGTIYWIELKNLLVTKRVTEDIFTGINAGKTRHQGFELLLHNRLMAYHNFPGELTSVFSYSRSLNRFIDFTDDSIKYDGKYLPGIPDQSMNLQFTWEPFKILEIVINLNYTGNQYLNDGNSLKYHGYTFGNIKMTTHIKMKSAGTFDLYAGINNITNTRYASMLIVNAQGFNNSEPRYYYPGLPRNGYAGIKYLF